MIRTTRIPLRLGSDLKAATNGPPIHVDGNEMGFQVTVAPANLVGFEGSLDGTNWINLNYDNVVGVYTLTIMALLGAGYYEVFECPKYVRMYIGADALEPQNFYAVLLVRKDSD